MSTSLKRILIVDDEARIRDVVTFALEKEGFRVLAVGDVATARALVASEPLDAIVLDVMLPDGDGLSFCRELRAKHQTPLLFLSARGDEIDRVLGLELGGDDYLTKPFSPRELVARVRALVRRSTRSVEAPPETKRLELGKVTLELERHEARCDGTIVALTATEFGLLVTLFERPGVVYSRAQLMQRAYAYDNLVTERTIDTHVKRVRAKFRALGADPIATVHGVGYKASDAAFVDG